MTSANKTGETKRESKAEYGRNGVEGGATKRKGVRAYKRRRRSSGLEERCRCEDYIESGGKWERE